MGSRVFEDQSLLLSFSSVLFVCILLRYFPF